MTSVVELILAALVSLWVFTSGRDNQIAITLCVVLVWFAIYSFCFYRFLFPRIIRKNAAQHYRKSSSLSGETTLYIYPDSIEEKSQNNENTYRWSELTALGETASLFSLELGEHRTLLIPKQELQDQRYLLEELLSAVCQKVGVKREKLF